MADATGAQASLPARRGFRGVSASVVELSATLRRGSHGVAGRDACAPVAFENPPHAD